MRKTINRSVLIESANRALRVDETKHRRNTADYRQGIISVTSSLLHESGSYCGFGYLYASDLDNPDNTAGINGEPGDGITDTDYLFSGTDQTRVYFH